MVLPGALLIIWLVHGDGFKKSWPVVFCTLQKLIPLLFQDRALRWVVTG
jgi:hypothetical protein